jgi:hypothetical protein
MCIIDQFGLFEFCTAYVLSVIRPCWFILSLLRQTDMKRLIKIRIKYNEYLYRLLLAYCVLLMYYSLIK